MPDTALLRQLEGFSLTTAEILYRLPDYPRLLQSYIWQDYDLAPRFPKLVDFLNFWATNLDGPLYRVRVAHRRLIAPQELNSSEATSGCIEVAISVGLSADQSIKVTSQPPIGPHPAPVMPEEVQLLRSLRKPECSALGCVPAGPQAIRPAGNSEPQGHPRRSASNATFLLNISNTEKAAGLSS